MSDYAQVSRQFLKDHKVYRYRMKKVNDMTDNEVIDVCHKFYEENHLVSEWLEYLERAGLE